MAIAKSLLGNERVRAPDPFGERGPLASPPATATRPVLGEDYRLVPLSAALSASPLQTRAPFAPETDEDDRALLESLRADGQRLPILLVEAESGYRLLDGHRRVAALRLLGSETVKAVIQRAGSLESDLTTLTANVRKNLSPLEQARAIERLHERHGLSWEVIAQKTGLTDRWLRELRGLLRADPALQAVVERGAVSARAAIELKDAPREQQAALAQVALANAVSAAQAAQLVHRVNGLGESAGQAAAALGLAASESQPPSRRETARSLLRRIFPELDEAQREALVERVAEDEKDTVLKLAGLLMLGGEPPADALLKHARVWAKAGGVRQLIAVVDGLARLQQRPIARGAQTPPWNAGLARKVAALSSLGAAMDSRR
jgi:ParB/RepB/Spo0J family partition protein